MLLNLRSANVGFEVTDGDKNKRNKNQVKVVSGTLNLQVFCPSSDQYGTKLVIENADSGKSKTAFLTHNPHKCFVSCK